MATNFFGSIAATNTSEVLLPANSSRSEAVIQNNSTAILYIAFDNPAGPTQYTTKLYTDDVLTTTFKGQINGIFSAATGTVMVTEVN